MTNNKILHSNPLLKIAFNPFSALILEYYQQTDAAVLFYTIGSEKASFNRTEVSWRTRNMHLLEMEVMPTHMIFIPHHIDFS